MSTKKLLVGYDENDPKSGQGDFLAVVFDGSNPIFFGLRTHRVYAKGRMVFIGTEVSEREIFVKLVDSGRRIESVDRTIKQLANYVAELNGFKIGDVLTVAASGVDDGFKLTKVSGLPKPNAEK